MRLFGWKRPDGRRRFKSTYLEVAKKNGKSAIVSALVLYLLVGDGEAGPEVYLNAYDKEQASIVFNEAAAMVRADEDLTEILTLVDSKKRIHYPGGNGLLRTNSADVPSKDGVNASGVVFDELHRQRTREMWDIFRYAGASRRQFLRISITTAGDEESGVWHEQRELSEAINSGEIKNNTTHLGVVYRALDTDDIEDPETWRKANPSLGVTISEEDFRTDLEEAKRSPAELATFKRLRLNIVTASATKFVDPEHWKACGKFPLIIVRTPKEPCWMGLDLSSINDLSALATIYGDADSGFDLYADFWLPEDNIVELEYQHCVPYRAWAQDGLITLTPGPTIDYGFIRRTILRRAEESALRKLLIDPYQAQKLASKLKDTDGLPVEWIRQGMLSLAAPTAELDRLIRSGKLRHGGNPVLSWMARNAIAVRDDAGNVKLSKRQSGKKIDGMSATVNAIAGATAPDSEAGQSIYETQGLTVI